MSYDKQQARNLGVEAVKTVQAVSDGLQTPDVASFITLGSALMSAADEFQSDKDAAFLDMLSGAASFAADLKLLPGATYDKAQVQAVGAALVGAGVAVSDGLDVSDINSATTLGSAILVAAGDFQTDKDAAILDLLSGAANALADLRRG
jgi:hypothetical protein